MLEVFFWFLGPAEYNGSMTTADEILSAAMALPPEKRAQLAEQLLHSLDEQPEIDPEWAREIERRITDLDEGKVTAIPYDQVKAELQKRIGERRG